MDQHYKIRERGGRGGGGRVLEAHCFTQMVLVGFCLPHILCNYFVTSATYIVP